MFEFAAAWSVLAGVAFVLTLAVAVETALAVASIWQLRWDVRVIEAAENFEAVDLTTVVRRYVLAEQQTNVPRPDVRLR